MNPRLELSGPDAFEFVEAPRPPPLAQEAGHRAQAGAHRHVGARQGHHDLFWNRVCEILDADDNNHENGETPSHLN